MFSRAQLHNLVDKLPEGRLQQAGEVLKALDAENRPDALTKILREAPYDDEPYTDADRAADDAAWARHQQGESLNWEEFKKTLTRG